INTRKLEAEVWGAYDPTKVLEYNGDYWFYAGGSYSGVSGEWNITLMKLSVNKASSDIFKDIPKFSDDDDSGSDDTGTQPPDGGITDHGLLSGLNDPNDHPWALQTDFSNVSDYEPIDKRYTRPSDIKGTPTEITSTDNGTGTVTLATPQDIDKDADMTLKSLLLKEGLDLDDVLGYIQTQDFNHSGFAGTGFDVKKDSNGDWTLVTDNIV